jgi:hypothetical protein
MKYLIGRTKPNRFIAIAIPPFTLLMLVLYLIYGCHGYTSINKMAVGIEMAVQRLGLVLPI